MREASRVEWGSVFPRALLWWELVCVILVEFVWGVVIGLLVEC